MKLGRTANEVRNHARGAPPARPRSTCRTLGAVGVPRDRDPGSVWFEPAGLALRRGHRPGHAPGRDLPRGVAGVRQRFEDIGILRRRPRTATGPEANRRVGDLPGGEPPARACPWSRACGAVSTTSRPLARPAGGGRCSRRRGAACSRCVRAASELLGIPFDGVAQRGLFPVADTLGTDFNPVPASLSTRSCSGTPGPRARPWSRGWSWV